MWGNLGYSLRLAPVSEFYTLVSFHLLEYTYIYSLLEFFTR